ncbi:hypothetical protein D3C72_876670 [compost metagenome]
MHPQSVVTCSTGAETATLQRLIGEHSAKRTEKTGAELAEHDALTGLAVRGIEVSQNGDISGLRVTPDEVKAEIGAEYSFTLDKALHGCPLVDGLDRVTIAVIVLKNGTKLVGVNYGAIDPKQHCPETGRREARAQAVEQIWPLLGFRLRDELARPVLTEADSLADLHGYQRPDTNIVLVPGSPVDKAAKKYRELMEKRSAAAKRADSIRAQYEEAKEERSALSSDVEEAHLALQRAALGVSA